MFSSVRGSAKRCLCNDALWVPTPFVHIGRWKIGSSGLSYRLRAPESSAYFHKQTVRTLVVPGRELSNSASFLCQLQKSRNLSVVSAPSLSCWGSTPSFSERDLRGTSWTKSKYSRMKQPRFQTQNGLFPFFLVDRSDDSDSNQYTCQRLRFFSDTTKPPQQERKEPDEKMKKIIKQKLSESTKSNMEDFVAGTLASTMKPIQETAKMRRRHKETAALLDNDRDYHNQIAKLQRLRKEAAQQKTATNVYRALCGNVIICLAKFGAWASSGSSSMLSEFIHSIVDCGNQSLLLVGLNSSRNSADRRHPYGYGKSVYFWALVSALGTFFLGAGVSMTHAIGDLLDPSLQTITWQVWGVLGLSFAVDGYVLRRTIAEILETKRPDVSYWDHVSSIRDPATLAVLLEDGAACLGIILAISGIALSSVTGNPVFDALAGVSISTLLGCMGLALVRVNHRFLLGTAVDREITDGIGEILKSRRSIDGIGSVQSQWISSETFSYKAEVDFDGTYLAARLMPIYQQEFLQIRDTMDSELQVLLALYAEDVMRTVEREVRHVETKIRKEYPGAEYIELEPMSRFSDQLAIYGDVEAELRRVESVALDKYLRSLKTEQKKREEQDAESDENK